MSFKNPFLDSIKRKKLVDIRLQNPEKEWSWNTLCPDEKSLFKRYRRSANDRGYEFKLTIPHFKSLIKSRCFYCGSKPYQKQGNILYMGIDRVDNNIGYQVNNVTSCCKICNRAKQGLSFEEFQNWMYSIKQEFDEREDMWSSDINVYKFLLSRGVQFKKEIVRLLGLDKDNKHIEKEKLNYEIEKIEYLKGVCTPDLYLEQDPKKYKEEMIEAVKRMVEKGTICLNSPY